MTASFDWVGPHRGPCGICGGPDARHRTADAILDRIANGEDPAEVAADYEIDPDLIPTSCENPVLVERERWKAAVADVRGRYPTDVFPDPPPFGATLSQISAAMARRTCDRILAAIEEDL